MKHIQKILTASAPGLLSMEEIEEQIEAAEPVAEAVDVVAETPALGEEPSDPLDVEAAELDADVDDFDESVDELETGADVAEKLEDTVQVMESLLDQVGAVSLVEYTSMSEFASTQMARLGVEFAGFSSEGIDDPAARLENLRLSTEAIKQQTADVKKAVVAAGKKVDEQSVSLWEKVQALMGSNAKRAKVLLAKLSKLSDEKREEIKLSGRVAGMLVNHDAVATAQAVNKACGFFYGSFFEELRKYASGGKDEKVPSVPDAILNGLPGNPSFELTESKAEFEWARIASKSEKVKVMSKGDIKRLLELVSAVAGEVRQAGLKWGGFGAKVAQVLAGGAMGAAYIASPLAGIAATAGGVWVLKKFSKAYRTEVAVCKAYRYFSQVISGLLKCASAHIAAYK